MKRFDINPPHVVPVLKKEKHPKKLLPKIPKIPPPMEDFGEFQSVRPLPPPQPPPPEFGEFQRAKPLPSPQHELSRMEKEDAASKEWRRKQNAPPSDFGSFFRQAFGFRQGGLVRLRHRIG